MDKIIVGNFSQGLTTNRLPFVIGDDAFPEMYNFYSWRGRVKRKRGTVFLGQMQIQVTVVSSPTSPWQLGQQALTSGAINLVTAFSLPVNSTIVSGTLSLIVNGQTYTEPSTPDGTLVGSGGGSGTINYATGAVTIVGGGSNNLTGTFSYYPVQPAMGLRDFSSSASSEQFPLLLGFDTTNSYQLNQTNSSVSFYNVNFFKTTGVPFSWSGADYQLFWTTNYPDTNSTSSGSLWATNNVPGLNMVSASYTSGSGTPNIIFNLTYKISAYTNLVVGDKLWFNEWSGGSTINGLVGTVTSAVGASSGNYTIQFTGNQTVSGTGVAQLLTNTVAGQDGIKWYDGDPTATTGIPAATGLGWVNFSPPLTATSTIIDTAPSALYYLVGAQFIVPFKDRLLFFSPWIQTSSGNPIQLQDTVIWSWNGTPYYTTPVPSGQTANIKAYYIDQAGLGGFVSVGTSKPILSVGINEDALIVGFGASGLKTRFVYTGNDLNPFLFFAINSEYPSTSPLSSVSFDNGMLDVGTYGICLTDQQSSKRIDTQIPDQIFNLQNSNNGTLRVNSIRDFYKEWVYIAYPVNTSVSKFPTQTFLFNYRDNTWAILYENFTCHGSYRATNSYTWNTLPFTSWDTWNEPWDSGSITQLTPNIIAGNPQGYVLIKGEGTGEGQSGTISAISAASTGTWTKITSPNHCVAVGDYLYFQGCLGSTFLNTNIGMVTQYIDANNFNVDINFVAGTYNGLGTFSRLCQPALQTKQFQAYWEQGKQVRLSDQKYLLDRTSNGQVTLNIYLSTDSDNSYNNSPVVPSENVTNNSLIYSQLLYTCPELGNLGLTAANINLQMPTSMTQHQIWHRVNTSLLGYTFQVGITLSDAQMRNLDYATSEISLHAMQFTMAPGPDLC